MKEIKLKGVSNLFEVVIDENEYLCTIENTDRDEYHVYSEKGEGFSVLKLDTVDIVELMVTGSINRNSFKVNSFAALGSIF